MTNLTVLLKQNTSDENDPEKSLFRSYWDKIEKAEKSYASAERKRNRIVERFNKEVRPLEEAYCKINYEVIEKLFTFLDKKALSDHSKFEIIEWVHELFEKLMNCPFRGDLDVDRLFNQLHQHEAKLVKKPTAEEIDVLKEEMAEMLSDNDIPLGEDGLDDILNAAMEGGPQAFFDELTKKAREFHDEESALDDEEYVHTEPKSAKNEETLSDQSLIKLYKRLAQRMHPDRATDDKDRAIRHNLMLELTEARRNKDTFTLLRLVRDYGEESDAIFSDQQLQHFVGGLQEKLDEIRYKKRALKTESSIDALIYARFHSRSNREMDTKFKNFKDDVKEDKSELEDLVKQLKNVKQLKKILSLRNSPQQALFEMGFTEDWL